MVKRHYNLPPLTALSSFEAAARNLSFKSAAQELNVTPGAISHQIRLLEAETGLHLFERGHRSVTLTSDGHTLFTALQKGFTEISGTLNQLRSAGKSRPVVVHLTTAVSALWLTPRLSEFWRMHSDVQVNQIVSDTPVMARPVCDLQIRYGHDTNPKKENHILFRDELLPLSSPEFLEKHGHPSLAELAALPLLHLDADDQSWTTWQAWFTHLGYDGEICAGNHFNSYMIALQAAQDGVGIVLGWRKLTQPFLDKGLLVPVSTYKMAAPRRFHIVADHDGRLSDNARLLKSWLVDTKRMT